MYGFGMRNPAPKWPPLVVSRSYGHRKMLYTVPVTPTSSRYHHGTTWVPPWASRHPNIRNTILARKPYKYHEIHHIKKKRSYIVLKTIFQFWDVAQKKHTPAVSQWGVLHTPGTPHFWDVPHRFLGFSGWGVAQSATPQKCYTPLLGCSSSILVRYLRSEKKPSENLIQGF